MSARTWTKLGRRRGAIQPTKGQLIGFMWYWTGKALDDQTVSTDLVSGASILGDGRVVLILNLPAIVERYANSRPGQIGAVASGILLSHADRSQTHRPVVEAQP